MIRRWLIRSFFIALCVGCVGAWVGSYSQYACVQYFGKSNALFFGGDCGWLWFGTYGSTRIGSNPWDVAHLPASEVRTRQQYLDTDWHRAGFAWKGDGKSRDFTAWIPFWFPTLISVLLFGFGWRKTRQKLVGTAFPVEPAKTPADSK